MAAVESYLESLRHTLEGDFLRLMMEYCHREHRYLEKPAGVFKPGIVQLWDDLFALCQRYGLRILLTPVDTFWMWKRWKHRPYNRANSGPCGSPGELLACSATREAIKARFAFAIRRWAGSGVLFAWDLWNEIHPAHSEIPPKASTVSCGYQYLHPVHGGGPLWPEPSADGYECSVRIWRLDAVRISEAIFRHPALDFANTHFYEEGTIDDPKNTVDAAISTGKLTQQALAEIRDLRPFFDSEHRPIHTFKDHHKSLPEDFDDGSLRHMQWAHFASGGAGGGMRWPIRKPHLLTAGMRRAQQRLAEFLPLIQWNVFGREKTGGADVQVSNRAIAAFACGDSAQAVLWLLRRDTITASGQLDPGASPGPAGRDSP